MEIDRRTLLISLAGSAAMLAVLKHALAAFATDASPQRAKTTAATSLPPCSA
jgi:hypothetical protein